MRILVSGSSGFIGSALVPFLISHAHEVSRLVRDDRKPGENTVAWNPKTGQVTTGTLKGFDAVVHLAAESIADGRWNESKKNRILETRVMGTQSLVRNLSGLSRPPKVLICASAIGFYGNRPDEIVDEKSSPGGSFLSGVCQAWEEASRPATQAGIRLVNLRIGVVLHPTGGALKKMLPPFQWGVGGMIGNGNQVMSWITRDELLEVIAFVLQHDKVKGPVNAVSPNPVTNREFTKTLGRVLGRPTLFPLPAIVAKTLLGEMADELLLASTRVEPKALQSAGYPFQHADLENALKIILGKA